MEPSKIALSEADWQQAAVPDLILTKNRVISGVYDLFGRLAGTYQAAFAPVAARFPGVDAWTPKISRGEKYRDMPWVMLDYPRCFAAAQGHFAIRTFFWWGHYFSIQLQLSGGYAQQLLPLLGWLQAKGWYVGCTDDPWDMELPHAGWRWPVESGLPDGGTWVAKAAKKIPIREWVQVETFMEEAYRELATMLAAGDDNL